MIYGLLLAAGQSQRFNGNKLLHKLSDDRSVVYHAAQNMCQVLERVMVVIRPGDQLLIESLQSLSVTIIECPDYLEGMSASIRCGIQASDASTSGWVIGLGDMPFVTAHTCLSLAKALEEGHGIAAPYYQQRRGNPVAFNSNYRDSLMLLTGDKGARDLLRSQESSIHKIDVDDSGVLIDIDTAEDMDRLSPAR